MASSSELQISIQKRAPTRRVLVLDADVVPALSVARSLKKIGLEVDISSHVGNTITGRSHCIERELQYPNPLTETALFIDWITAITERQEYDVIIPVTERTVRPLSKYREAYDSASVAMASNESLLLAIEKHRTVALAQSLDIPVPKSVLISDLGELSASMSQFNFPIVIKPSSSVNFKQSSGVQLVTRYAFDRNELQAKAAHALLYGPVILQEYFQGDGVGIELIADQGTIAYAFQHKRIHETPLTGGGSSLRKSVDIVPTLLDAAERLMAAMKWHGVAMVEFKVNPTSGDFRLMEINGRFWGSLPLAAAAGANFPAMLYQLHTDGAVKQYPPARPGVYCRNLSRDMLWLESVLRRNEPSPLVTFPSWKAILRDTLLVFHWKHEFDVQSLGDPLPGIIDLWRIVTSYVDRAKHLRSDRKLLKAQKRAWAANRVMKKVRDAKQILFVCYGNINRSALAQCYAEKCFNDSVSIVSAGLHKESGRPADPVMCDIAQQYGIDMSACTSRVLDDEAVASADVIFVMELAQYKALLRDYPDAKFRTFLLGLGDPVTQGHPEIVDPYGKPRAVYEHVFARVVNSINGIAQHPLSTSQLNVTNETRSSAEYNA